MNLKFWKRSSPSEPKSPTREWVDAILFAVIAATIIRWAFLEAFTIPTPSMEKSLLVGDFLFVSKVHYGPRTPKTPLQMPLTHQKIWFTDKFVDGGVKSYLEWIQLPQYRLPGLQDVERNDVVVFNYPLEFQHPVDLKTNYIKRCIGISGDVVEIQERQVYINGKKAENPEEMQHLYELYLSGGTNSLRERVFEKHGVTLAGQSPQVDYFIWATEEAANSIAQESFVKEVKVHEEFPPGQANPRVYPKRPDLFDWNQDNFGPLTIPAKGMTIPLDERNLALYGFVIENYEGHDDVKVEDERMLIDGEEITEYTFKQNYYFMMGDNRHNSEDSRFWGFVPEDHIVGKAFIIWFSWDGTESFFQKVRWERLFDLIK